MQRTSTLSRVLMSVGLWSFVFFLAFPFAWLISTAFKPTREIFTNQGMLPINPTLENFGVAISDLAIFPTVWNTFKVSLVAALITLVIAIPAAYMLARRPSGINRLVVVWILLSQVFPVILIIVPLFLLLAQFGLVNTHLGLIAVYIVWGLPFVLWMLQGYIKSIPVELKRLPPWMVRPPCRQSVTCSCR